MLNYEVELDNFCDYVKENQITDDLLFPEALKLMDIMIESYPLIHVEVIEDFEQMKVMGEIDTSDITDLVTRNSLTIEPEKVLFKMFEDLFTRSVNEQIKTCMVYNESAEDQAELDQDDLENRLEKEEYFR